ncbi:MAG: hypothetical protein JWS12_328 [Candidatus Saccharibacteria bacterium]|nr:hypothetical protein [Candidatus Saccharibacteria bacterium]
MKQRGVIATDNERLLMALANQMKLPLMQIARLAELANLQSSATAELATITFTADTALRLIDSYLLGAQLMREQQTLDLEPVSLSAVMYEAVQQLQPVANQYQCELELSLGGKYGPVMAHRAGLTAALTSLGQVFIEAQSQSETSGKHVLTLAAHRSQKGIVAGVFANVDGLGATMYRRAGALYGRARQPLTGLSANSGAGVFVADSLFSAMASQLKLSHHHKLVGLAATFIPSNQMSLV